MNSRPRPAEPQRPVAAILVGGAIAGVLDISSAVFSWLPSGVSPVRIFQSVAAGLYGVAAREGGWKTAVIGLICHFIIAFGAATVFYLASRVLRFMTDHPIIAGLLYGEAVYLFMANVVLPLSAIGHRGTISGWQSLVTGPVGHLFFVGLPISLAVHRFARPASAGR